MIALISALGRTLRHVPLLVGVERHELDEAHLVGLLARELREAQHLVLGEPAQGDGVDLDRPQLGMRLGGLQAGEDAVQRVAPGELEEAVGGERVERDVDPAQAGGDEVGDLGLEQVPVGREREVVDARDRPDRLDQAPQLLADERLAAGEAHVVDAHLAEDAHEPGDLLVGEQRVALEPRQALGRHAVLAAEVAAVGDRDAHVADGPAVPVDQRLARRAPHARWKSDFPPVLSSSSTRSITTPGSMPLTMS